jgi:hypothetical protein
VQFFAFSGSSVARIITEYRFLMRLHSNRNQKAKLYGITSSSKKKLGR